ERLALAQATGDALAEAGRIDAAVAVFRRALEFNRSAELVERVDQLLVQQGTPEERLELYESALRNESDPAQRVPLLRSIAELRQRELRDYAGAITAWRAVLSENPNDRAATLALVDALSEDGELEIAYAELEQLLGQTEGE